ncbi:MAG TPA: hypothetical protein EYP63_00575 [Desulfotomaculum sp.]|nr:hypothetical protein [Desulfotomaculum sp.]
MREKVLSQLAMQAAEKLAYRQLDCVRRELSGLKKAVRTSNCDALTDAICNAFEAEMRAFQECLEPLLGVAVWYTCDLAEALVFENGEACVFCLLEHLREYCLAGLPVPEGRPEALMVFALHIAKCHGREGEFESARWVFPRVGVFGLLPLPAGGLKYISVPVDDRFWKDVRLAVSRSAVPRGNVANLAVARAAKEMGRGSRFTGWRWDGDT